jgi:hypothetical protein
MFKPINQSLIIFEQVYLPPLSPHKESIMTHPTRDSFTTPSELDPVMDALFAFNRYYQELCSGAKDELPAADYVATCATLRIDPGRISGKSTWIAAHTKEGEAIAIVPPHMVDNPLHQALYQGVANTFTLNDVWAGKCQGLAYRRVYVDDASELLPTPAAVQQLLEALITDYDQMVVLIG